MRASSIRSLLATSALASALAASGCTLVLGLDAYQRGLGADASAAPDASTSDPDAAVPIDAAPPIDAAVPIDAAPPIDAHPYLVGGVVEGLLPGVSVTVSITSGGATSMHTLASTGGPLRFSFERTASDYEVAVPVQPDGSLCIVRRGEGSAAADVDDVLVGCSTREGLVAYFPLDGDLEPAPPVVTSSGPLSFANWTRRPVLPPGMLYVTDRFGDERLALGPVESLSVQLDESIHADASVVGTGYAVAMWVREEAPFATSLIAHVDEDSTAVIVDVVELGGRFHLNHYLYWDGSAGSAIDTSNLTAPSELPMGRWVHVVATTEVMNASSESSTHLQRRLYVDGMRVATLDTCCAMERGSRWWEFGGADAARDDVRIYARPLEDIEVHALFASERAD